MIKSLLLILSIFLFSACGGRDKPNTHPPTQTMDASSPSEVGSENDSVSATRANNIVLAPLTQTTDNSSLPEASSENDSNSSTQANNNTTIVPSTQSTDTPSSSEASSGNDSISNQLLSLDMFINSRSCSQVVDKVFYTVCYNHQLKAAKAVGYTLSGDLVNELNIKKRPSFKVERSISRSYRASVSDYKYSGYDRGHIAPDASFDWSNESLESTYSLINIMPQARKVNRYTWTKAERYERYIAVQLGSVHVVNVLKYSSNPKRIGQHGIAVPYGYYKILFNHEENYSKCLYYVNDNNIVTSEDRLKNHEISCTEILY